MLSEPECIQNIKMATMPPYIIPHFGELFKQETRPYSMARLSVACLRLLLDYLLRAKQTFKLRPAVPIRP